MTCGHAHTCECRSSPCKGHYPASIPSRPTAPIIPALTHHWDYKVLLGFIGWFYLQPGRPRVLILMAAASPSEGKFDPPTKLMKEGKINTPGLEKRKKWEKEKKTDRFIEMTKDTAGGPDVTRVDRREKKKKRSMCDFKSITCFHPYFST